MGSKIPFQWLIFFSMFFLVKKTMAIETPTYEVLKKNKVFEIRQYNATIIAKTDVKSDFKGASSTGFRRIANYIFGGNSTSESIAMTAPVITTSSSLDQEYEVLFFMPVEYNMTNLPKPNLSNVEIEERFLGKIASVKFGGWVNEKNTKYYTTQLKDFLKQEKYEIIGPVMVAQYNSPWALPPFRKNEILVKVN